MCRWTYRHRDWVINDFCLDVYIHLHVALIFMMWYPYIHLHSREMIFHLFYLFFYSRKYPNKKDVYNAIQCALWLIALKAQRNIISSKELAHLCKCTMYYVYLKVYWLMLKWHTEELGTSDQSTWLVACWATVAASLINALYKASTIFIYKQSPNLVVSSRGQREGWSVKTSPKNKTKEWKHTPTYIMIQLTVILWEQQVEERNRALLLCLLLLSIAAYQWHHCKLRVQNTWTPPRKKSSHFRCRDHVMNINGTYNTSFSMSVNEACYC